MLHIWSLRNGIILVPNHDREVAPVEKMRRESENEKIEFFLMFSEPPHDISFIFALSQPF